jgi:sec-independent protein translocase protein TatC
MVKEPEEEEQLALADEDEGGGPVKSFLEHLEDLRWTLIKCVAATLIGMLVCLMASNKLVAILEWPLKKSQTATVASTVDAIPLYVGTNIIGTLNTNFASISGTTTNYLTGFRVVPVQVGTNWIPSLEPDFNPVEPVARLHTQLKNYGPLSGIMVALKLGIYGGLIFASPFLLYFIGQFVLPALKVREKKVLYRAVAFGSVLFFIGVIFCYFLVAVFALKATVQFSQWLGFGADEWRAEEYITFMCRFMLGMGLAFELPVVILTLVKIEILDYAALKRFRQYAIVGNLILAAFATPSGDPITMFLMAIPLQILYEVSTLVAWYWERRDRKRLEKGAG